MPKEVSARPRLRASAAALAVAFAAAACVNVVDIEGSDDSVFFAGGRVSYRIEPESRPAVSEAAPPAPAEDREQFHMQVELDASYGQGDDTMRLGAGESIDFGGSSFAGPSELALSFDLTRVRANARAVMPIGDGVSIQLLGGLEYSAMAVSVDNSPYLPPAAGKDSLSSFGPAFGVGLAWSPARWIELSGEAAYSFGFSDNADIVELGVCDAGASLWPRERVALFLGWRWSRYRAEALDDALSSDVDLDLAGPVIALRLGF